MRAGEPLLCRDSQRRALLQRENCDPNSYRWNGLDYVEYESETGGESALLVYFLCEAGDLISDDFELETADGRRVELSMQVRHVGPRCVRLILAKKLCKPQAYRLKVKETCKYKIDPQFAMWQFTATADEIEIDPVQRTLCASATTDNLPQFNYLARDFSSLRQLLLDRLSLLIPQWKERHGPDLGVTLVELFAYVGDYLSYYQDSVATEAYLNTARQRISVRRHVRLVDYQLHEGCNARNFIHLQVQGEVKLDPQQVFFITAHPDEKYAGRFVLPASTLEGALPNSYVAFEPRQLCPETGLLELYEHHNEIAFYTWNQLECCLPAGATRATLLDPSEPFEAYADAVCGSCDGETKNESQSHSNKNPTSRPEDIPHVGHCYQSPQDEPDGGLPCLTREPEARYQKWGLRYLRPGSVLLLEEILGPKTHSSDDADPMRKWIVRLTRVQPCIDPVTGQRLVKVEWAAADALPFPLCISSVGPAVLGCRHNDRISVARGNLVLADNGLMIDSLEWLGEVHYHQPLLDCDADDALTTGAEPTSNELLRPILKEPDLTFATPIDGKKSAKEIFDQKPEDALPQLRVFGFPISKELADSFRPVDVQPATLVTFADLENPLGLLERFGGLELNEQRRLEALLPPTTAQFLDTFRSRNAKQNLDRLRRLTPMIDAFAASRLVNESCSESTERITAAPKTADDELREQYLAFCVQLQAAMEWQPRRHLLDSTPEDQHVVVEIDNERRCHLRFGDDQLGKRPLDNTSFYAKYRRGNGIAGNVGADKIQHLMFRHQQPSGVTLVRNPRPARGGTDLESLDHARLHAPRQFHKLRRAITAEDYAQLVRDRFPDRVQRARATLEWIGPWFEVAVAVDPVANERDPETLVREAARYLWPRRRIGHSVRISLPTYVGVHLSLTVCVAGGFLRAHVRQELLDIFSNRIGSDGRPGFFYPDNFSFGDALYLSRIVQEAQKVRGIENLVVTRLERWGQGDHGERDAGVIEFGPLEIPCLDNDPLRPERGCFCLDMRGAR